MNWLLLFLAAGANTSAGAGGAPSIPPEPPPVSSEAYLNLTYAIEMDFERTGTWVNVIDDIRSQEPIVIEYGIQGDRPDDRIASAGSLTFLMDNLARNSGGLVGYYSPQHVNTRAGFGLNVPVRMVFHYEELTRYKFFGSLADIVPAPGLHGERIVSCLALDWWDDAGQIDMPDLPAQTNKRADEVLQLILDAMTIQPRARHIDVGLETFVWSLDGGTGQRLKVRERINQLTLSEWGACYITGDATGGGTLRFENRQYRASNPAITITIVDEDIDAPDGIAVLGSRDDVYSSIQVYVYPTTIDAAPTVLYSLEAGATLVQNQQPVTIFGPFTAQVSRDPIGGTGLLLPLTPITDFTVNEAPDGSGADITAQFTVDAIETGEGVWFTITNTGLTHGYLTTLQVRGYAIRRTQTIVEEVSLAGVAIGGSVSERALTLDMPFQNNPNLARSLGQYLSVIYGVPFSRAKYVRFLARGDRLMRAALEREPGDRVVVSETVTGVNGIFTINAVRLELHGSNQVWCTWTLEPARENTMWVLGVSILDVDTILGF